MATLALGPGGDMASLSACVYTRDNAGVVVDAVASLRFADEVILLDSGSTDDTVEAARPHVDRIEHRDWTGFRDQLEHIGTLATHDWVLVLDADERVTPAGAEEIRRVLESPRHDAYEIPRMSRYLGRWLKHGEFYPDYTLRLYRRGSGHYEGEPHARFVCSGSVGRLHEPLQHLLQKDLGEQLDTMRRYGEEHARTLAAQGVRSARWAALVHGVQRFMKGYVFKAGFLDGWPGFVAAITSSFHVFLKYVRVEEAWLESRRETPPC